MAQGKIKGMQAKVASARHAQKAASNTKKGQRAVPPKKQVLIKQAQLHKNLSAKINKSIEQQMVNAASAGKLTIMKGIAQPEGSTSKKGPSKKITSVKS
ncbi:hypothetical protein BD626DRAFT_629719 [Schizophyllum amplum]|uniref:Uncharacterized protein n=1 Tax=Schizophyllum amplum TaxID=97359 RepID=A0A550CGP4_9AGAR|nr:hypothetical protein BD626DRAFT_629719 [Auriculariopsis ampla]